MAIPVKAIFAGTAVVGVGGTGVWMLSTLGMPGWRPLVQDEGFWNNNDVDTSYKGKYAEKYARLLVGAGTSKSDEKTVSNNKAWWDWAYNNLYDEDKAKGGFMKLKQGSKTSDSEPEDKKSLQTACANAYKANTSDVIETDPQDSETSKFKEEQIWKFCSPIGKKPKTVGEMTEGEDNTNIADSWKDRFGANNKNDLLAISAKENADAWQHLEKQAKSDDLKPSSGFFSKDVNGVNIKEKCKSAYARGGTSDTGEDKPSEDDLYKWCSLRGKKVTTTSV